MSSSLLLRKEVGDVYRNRQLHVFVAAFALLFGLIAYLHTGQGAVEPLALVRLLEYVSIVFVPAAALMTTHETIAKKRENGQLKLLFGLPHSRRDLVTGAYLGRFGALAAAIVAGAGVAALVVLVRGATLAAGALAAFLLVTLGLALAYVAIGIGVSASVRSTTLAAAGAFGVFMLFVLAWRFVPDGLPYLLNGFERPAEPPSWVPYVYALSPSVAYETLADAFVFDGESPMGADVSESFAAAVLLGWSLLAPALGLLRFRSGDL